MCAGVDGRLSEPGKEDADGPSKGDHHCQRKEDVQQHVAPSQGCYGVLDHVRLAGASG